MSADSGRTDAGGPQAAASSRRNVATSAAGSAADRPRAASDSSRKEERGGATAVCVAGVRWRAARSSLPRTSSSSSVDTIWRLSRSAVALPPWPSKTPKAEAEVPKAGTANEAATSSLSSPFTTFLEQPYAVSFSSTTPALS